MSLIKCPECGKEISDKAKTCPNCGIPLKNRTKLIIAMVITIIMILIVVGCVVWYQTKNSHQKVSQTKPTVSTAPIATVENTVKPLNKIELNSSNVSNYIDCKILCEDFKQDNIQKDFLGFTNYYYSANAHITISPKKGKKFENVQIKLRYNYDNDLYEDLYYSLGTVTINLNQDGIGEIKQSMNFSLLLIPNNSPKMKNENIEIIDVSGYVYDEDIGESQNMNILSEEQKYQDLHEDNANAEASKISFERAKQILSNGYDEVYRNDLRFKLISEDDSCYYIRLFYYNSVTGYNNFWGLFSVNKRTGDVTVLE